MIYVDLAVRNVTLAPSFKSPNTFSHIGVIVPDTQAVQERLDRFGVECLKRVDENTGAGAVASATHILGQPASLGLMELEFVQDLLGRVNTGFILALDPGVNVLEIQPQNGGDLVKA